MTTSSFILIVRLALVLAPLALGGWALFFLLSLPLRRQERARLFLDLLELGLKDGRSPEQTIVGASQSRDDSMGSRFHLLAAHIENGLRLGAALDQVPGLLPASLAAMLKTGESLGDVRKVLPACRVLLQDGYSQTRSAMNYMVLIFLALTPAAPAVLIALARFVLPKLLLLMRELEVPVPAVATWMVHHSDWLAALMTGTAFLVYLAALFYVAGPRLAAAMQPAGLPWRDWLTFRLPWRRKRMQRNFAAMLGILLDAGVPEETALGLAAAVTDNLLFQGRAGRAAADLRAGHNLAAALGRVDETGELRWRLANAAASPGGFRAGLDGWLEGLDARAFQQEQAVAQVVTTGIVLANGAVVGSLAVGTFMILISVIQAGILW